jgi:hypothetical protein
MDYEKFYENEKNTIIAIKSLSVDFPYAAAMLIYILIERFLKVYILKNRYYKELFDPSNKKFKRITNSLNSNNADFIHDILNDLTLGNVEILINLNNKPYSTNRNNLMHSNTYLSDDVSKDDKTRQKKNDKIFKESLIHLFEVVNDPNYSSFKVEIENGDIIIL